MLLFMLGLDSVPFETEILSIVYLSIVNTPVLFQNSSNLYDVRHLGL